jgi:hypothetical protein
MREYPIAALRVAKVVKHLPRLQAKSFTLLPPEFFWLLPGLPGVPLDGFDGRFGCLDSRVARDLPALDLFSYLYISNKKQE